MGKNSEHIGKLISNYQLIKNLGNGTFGSVYLANHRYLNRTIAIKILHPNYSATQKARDAFFQEAQFLDALKHRHILPIIDVGIQDDLVYMMLEYAPDGSLTTRIEERFPALLPMKESLLIISQIGQALQYAHTYKPSVVHRDVKPSNILFNDKREALLADFGIAVALEGGTKEVGSIEGSFPYMAPEQFKGQASLKSDQYALACIAYELLTGHKPIIGPDNMPPEVAWMVWQQRHEQDQPIPPSRLNPDIPFNIEEAILKGLEKDRTKRHISVATFIGHLIFATRLLDLSELPTMALSKLPIPVQLNRTSTEKEKAPVAPKKTAKQWVSEGNSLYRDKHFEEAINAFEQAIQQGHKDSSVFYILGNMLRELKKAEEALDAYEQAIQLDAKNDLFYNSKGSVFCDLKRYGEALQAYKQAIQLAPNKAILHKNHADVLRELGEYGEALKAYEKVIQFANNNKVLKVKAHIGKGDILLKLRNREEALNAYERAIELEPDNVGSHTIRGDILWRLKRNEEAVHAYEQAIKLDPNNADLYSKKGSALMPLGKTKEAQQAYEKAQQLGKR